jgi:hypothetical protein
MRRAASSAAIEAAACLSARPFRSTCFTTGREWSERPQGALASADAALLKKPGSSPQIALRSGR